MAYTLKRNVDIAIKEEVTEGTYIAPDAGSDFIATLIDGNTVAPSKELVERAILNGSIGKNASRHGLRSVSGTLQVEMKAQGTEGSAPEYGLLMESALGGTRASAAIVSGTGHTASVLQIADTSALTVGDIVTIEETGAYHTSPIIAIVADTSIELLVAGAGAFSDNVTISAFTAYYPTNSGHPKFSVSKWSEDEHLEKGIGCTVNSLALSNYTPATIATWDFGFEGLNYDREISTNSLTPSFDAALPPIILEACAYVDGVSIELSEVGFTLENALAFVTTVCSASGRSASKASERSITGSFTGYKYDDNVTMFNRFDEETEFSLYFRAYVPTATSGEYGDVVAVYMPKCKLTEVADADQDGIQQNSFSYEATRGNAGDTDEIVISFS